MGVVDNDGIGIGHVQARLDNAGAYQDVEFLAQEGVHDPFQVTVFHLPMGHRHTGLGHPGLHFFGQAVYVLHAVVDHKHLASAGQFILYRLRQNHIVPLHELGLYRQAVYGRRVNQGDIPDSRHAQVQRPGNRRSAHAEGIHRQAELPETFLLLDAKLLLFVYDEQAQVLEMVLLA